MDDEPVAGLEHAVDLAGLPPDDPERATVRSRLQQLLSAWDGPTNGTVADGSVAAQLDEASDEEIFHFIDERL